LLLLLLLRAVMSHQGATTAGAALHIRVQLTEAMALQAERGFEICRWANGDECLGKS